MIPETPVGRLKHFASSKLKAWNGWGRVSSIVAHAEVAEARRATQARKDVTESLLRSLSPGDEVRVTSEDRSERTYTVKLRKGTDVVLDWPGDPMLVLDGIERDKINIVSGAGVRRVHSVRRMSTPVPEAAVSDVSLPTASSATIAAYQRKQKNSATVVTKHGVSVLARYVGEPGLLLSAHAAATLPPGPGMSGWSTALLTLAEGPMVPVTLTGGVKLASVATTDSENRAFAMRCVRLAPTPQSIWGYRSESLGLGSYVATATDGNRLMMVRYESSVPFPVLVSGDAAGKPGPAWASKNGTTVLSDGTVYPGEESEFPNFEEVLPQHAPTEIQIPAATVQAFLASRPKGVKWHLAVRSSVAMIIGDDSATMLVQWSPGDGFLPLEQKTLAEFPVDLIRADRSGASYRGVFGFDATFLYDALINCPKDARWLIGDKIGITGIFFPGQVNVIMPIRLDDEGTDKHIEKMRALIRERSRGVGNVSAPRVAGIPAAPPVTGTRLGQLVSSDSRYASQVFASPVNQETWIRTPRGMVRFQGHAVDQEYRYDAKDLATMAKALGSKPVTQLFPGAPLGAKDRSAFDADELAPYAGPYHVVETPNPALWSVLASFSNPDSRYGDAYVVAHPIAAIVDREGCSHAFTATDGSCLHIIPGFWPNQGRGLMPGGYVVGPPAVSETMMASGNFLVKLGDPSTETADVFGFLSRKFQVDFSLTISQAQVKGLLADVKKLDVVADGGVAPVTLNENGTAQIGQTRRTFDKSRLSKALTAALLCPASVQMAVATMKGANGPTLFLRQSDSRGLLQLHVLQGMRFPG